ncbi:hypothetical protein BDAP_002311 [Binucleata daphniae]
MVSSENFTFDNIENEPSEDYSQRISKPKRERRPKKEVKENSNRKIVNLPAEKAVIRVIDGEEWLCFKYNTKISDAAMNTMPRHELEENEFAVRFDLESIDITKLNDKFKHENCVYERAICEKEKYDGNRWDYETDCNRFAWQFVSLNPVLLYGKKGLIQRAVDSYRWLLKENSTLMHQDEIVNGVVRRKYVDSTPTTVPIYWANRGCIRKCRTRVDIENVNYEKIDDDFKAKYSIYSEEFDDTSFGLTKYENKNIDNELAVKIAYLNIDNTAFWNAVKVTDLASMIRKAVEAYKKMDDEYESDYSAEEALDFGDIVSSTLDQVYDDDDVFPFLNDKLE